MFHDPRQSVQDFYEQQGAAFSRTRQMKWAEMELAASYIKAGMTVVDIGAGNGRFAQQISSISQVHYIGVEPSSTLRANSLIPLQTGLLPHLSLTDSLADVTVCFAVFHHLTKEQREASVQELLRITKPGGFIIASSWYLPIEDYEAVQDGEVGDIWVPWKAEEAETKRYVHIYSLEEWKRLWNLPTSELLEIGYFGKTDWTQDLQEARNLLVILKKT